MKLSRLAAFQMVLSGCLLAPSLLAQKREDILSIQRDVAQLQDQIKQLQTSQDQKLTALESLIKQALDQSNQASASMTALQRTLTDRLNDQQSKVAAPIAVLGTKVDQSSDDVRAVRENLAALSNRVANLDNKLSDISSAVRTLSQPPSAPPPPASGAPPAAGAAPIPPAGTSAESLWLNAFRDYSSGKDDLAMMEFNDYLKYFPTAENAASAQYYVGQLYNRAKMFDDAVQAFDAVLERYPDNPKTPDAMYGKADALAHGGHKSEAAAEFKEFLARFPTHSLARNAQAQLRDLGPAAASRQK
ncbi:MAG TPA: tetratricopeptide repeat protein [Bryobacteraceae bacterium]|jgi:TolA-binding protein|nr:tetratricopeptide repeat protein [Bryobacteraceae bacterium]